MLSGRKIAIKYGNKFKEVFESLSVRFAYSAALVLAAQAGPLFAAPKDGVVCAEQAATQIGLQLCAEVSKLIPEGHAPVSVDILDATDTLIRARLVTSEAQGQIYSLRVQDSMLSDMMIARFAATLAATLDEGH